MKFGDIVVNNLAGKGNLYKVLLYISGRSKAHLCLARDGTLNAVIKKSSIHPDLPVLTVVGHIDFSGWDNKISEEMVNDFNEREVQRR